MSVKPIIPSIDSNKNNSNKFKQNVVHNTTVNYSLSLPQEPRIPQAKSVSFQGGSNPIVGLMDFIEAGGYAASFCIQDGLGFIAPRVGKGLYRGGKKKKDENGNDILDENGKPKRELNWAYARKEALREIITGPSAFLIPLGMLAFINRKFGFGNNVKLNYIDSFKTPFTEYAQNNVEAIKAGTANKSEFYEAVFKDAINKSINPQLPDGEKMSADEIAKVAREYTDKQLQIEAIQADKSLNKKARNAKIAEIGTVEDAFMKLKKSKVGGTVDEMAVQITSSKGGIKNGSIGELVKAMNDYFGDAVNNTKKALSKDASAVIENVVKNFTNRRMGSRILTNLGIFGVVAAFYTQIPKLYNMGTNGKNPALAHEEEEEAQEQAKAATAAAGVAAKQAAGSDTKKDVPFTGMASFLEKTGEKVFNGKHTKSISDIFELNGPIMSGNAMAVLLYAFCIPPRLQNAQDKYDYGEIVVRDMTAFTALLFGAKALARLFSDGFTKITGLALNKKNMDGRNVFQKVIDYLNPNDTRHSVLSSKQLNSKYTHIEDYKNGVGGFMEFIEGSGGNVKKAFAQDKDIKAAVDEILKDFNGKSFKDASASEIKEALIKADKAKNDLIKKFYKLFEGDNGLLRKAKTCNSAFGFLSTLVLVPGLIIWLTDFCEKMTERNRAEDKAKDRKAKAAEVEKNAKVVQAKNAIPSAAPTMAGFLHS